MAKFKDGEYISLAQFFMIILFSVFLFCSFILIDKSGSNKNINNNHILIKQKINYKTENDKTNFPKLKTDSNVNTRGIRNNNPLNIRYVSKTKWLGAVKTKEDTEFEEFTDVHYGFRAAYITLMTYREKYNLNTINGIIHRFSPSNENNTVNIIKQLEYMTGFDKDETLNKDDYIILIQKMAIIESGYKFPLSLIKESISIK